MGSILLSVSSCGRDVLILYGQVCEKRKLHSRARNIPSETKKRVLFLMNYSGPRVGFPCPTPIHYRGYMYSLFEIELYRVVWALLWVQNLAGSSPARAKDWKTLSEWVSAYFQGRFEAAKGEY